MRKLLVLFALVLTCLGFSPVAQAYEMSRILLPPVLDTANYRMPELNAALLDKTRDHFKFPRYDVIRIELPAAKMPLDKAWMEKQVADQKADGIVVIEIPFLRSYTRILSDDEIIDETALTLVLHFFDPKTGQYGKIKADRSVTQIASIHSGALPVSVETIIELLRQLEKVFPRTFTAPSR